MKNILILGDSYSTYKNLIPEGYATWYPGNDVQAETETWWKIALKGADVNLVLNSSFSGTTICHTGYSGDCSHKSFLARLEKLSAEGFFEKNKIDEIWIFGGTNDSGANSPLGEIMYGEISREEKFKVLPGFSALLALVKSLPIERPLILINSELKPEIENGYKEMAAHYGIPALQLKDVDKKDGHPTVKGMKEIAEQFLAFRREV